VLGAPALFATVYGNVGSSIYYALGVTAVYALGLTPLVFLIAGIIFAATTLTYAEGTVRYPEAGGSSSFARHAFNEVVSFGAAWAQMLNYIITIAISAFFVPHYLSIFWEPLRTNPWDIIVGAIVIVVLVLLNIVGIREAAKLNIGLAFIDFATQLLLVLLGFALIFSPHTLSSNIHWGTAPTWSNFLLAIPVGMIAYTGIETVSNLAEEARDPARNVPRAYLMTVVAVFAIFFTLPAIALSALPVHRVAEACKGLKGHFETALACPPPEGFQNDPVLGLISNIGIHNDALLHGLKIYVGILAATILFIATNAGVIGASRITYAMAHYRQLPEIFRRVHPRFRTPWISLIVFAGIISILTLLPGKVSFLGTMYSFGAMLSFTIAHISVLRLRQRYPDLKRGWKPPLNFRVRGVELPLTALLGGLGTFSAWIVVMALNLRTLFVGAGWMAFGLAVYFIYRSRCDLPLTSTVKTVTPEPLGVEEVEYRSILLAFEEEPFSEDTVATAVRLAARRRRGIHVVSIVNVPTHLPLDAPLDAKESEAQSKIEQAKLIGGMRVTGHLLRVRPGQAGQAIVEEARAIKAAAVVMQLRYRNGSPLYGRTIQTVLAERPGRVIVVAQPGEALRAA
jgi:basic amino acid/polyamine antiporter, APA family